MNNLGTFSGERAIYIPVATYEPDGDVKFEIIETVLYSQGRVVQTSPMAWGATEDKMWAVFKPPEGLKPGVYVVRVTTQETFPPTGDAPDEDDFVCKEVEDFAFRWGPVAADLADRRLAEVLDESIGQDGKLKISGEAQNLSELRFTASNIGKGAVGVTAIDAEVWDAFRATLCCEEVQKAVKLWFRDVLKSGVDARVGPVEVKDRTGYQLAKESIDAILPPALLKTLSRLQVDSDGGVRIPKPGPLEAVDDNLPFSQEQKRHLYDTASAILSKVDENAKGIHALATNLAADLKRTQETHDVQTQAIAELGSTLKMLATAVGAIPDPPVIPLVATAVLTELSSGGAVLSVSVPAKPATVEVQLLDGSGAVVINNSQWKATSVGDGAFSFALPEMQPHGVRYARVIVPGEKDYAITVPVVINRKPQQPMMVMAAPGATSNG